MGGFVKRVSLFVGAAWSIWIADLVMMFDSGTNWIFLFIFLKEGPTSCKFWHGEDVYLTRIFDLQRQGVGVEPNGDLSQRRLWLWGRFELGEGLSWREVFRWREVWAGKRFELGEGLIFWEVLLMEGSLSWGEVWAWERFKIEGGLNQREAWTGGRFELEGGLIELEGGFG